jgi:proteasome lid subunit RPN8/RPN11
VDSITQPDQLEKIKAAALSVYPHEMCGLLTAHDFIPCDNLHETPKKAFIIDPLVIRKHAGLITGIVHSHTRKASRPEVFDLRTPSYRDMVGAQKSGVPWFIVGTEGETVTPPVRIPRVPSNVYLERQFIWFINDCYTLVQDYYRFELGIVLQGHKADFDFRSHDKLDGIFDRYLLDYGFKAYQTLDGIKNGDVLLLSNGGHQRNHLGIYHDGQVLHQDLLSILQPLEYFIGGIHAVLKYEG